MWLILGPFHFQKLNPISLYLHILSVSLFTCFYLLFLYSLFTCFFIHCLPVSHSLLTCISLIVKKKKKTFALTLLFIYSYLIVFSYPSILFRSVYLFYCTFILIFVFVYLCVLILPLCFLIGINSWIATILRLCIWFDYLLVLLFH